MANQYIYQLTDSWTDAGTTYNAIKMDVTDGGSAAASTLLNLQLGGTSQFKVLKALNGYSVAEHAGNVVARYFITPRAYMTGTSGDAGFVAGSAQTLGWSSSSAPDPNSDTVDTRFYRDAAYQVAQRNSTNAQTFRVYNTFTDASNYERGKLEWASNVLRIGTEKAGTGTARAMEFQTDGTTRLTVSATSAGLTIASGGNIGISGSSTIMTGSYIRANDFSIETDTPVFRMGVSGDVRLTRDAAAILAQRNGTNAQTFNIYNTYTNSTNYERLSIEAQSGASVRIRTNKGSGGGTAQALELGTDATTALTLTTAQKAEFAATIKTAAPAGGTAAEWKLGVAASVTPTSPNRTIEVDIGGTIYYVHAKTTND